MIKSILFLSAIYISAIVGPFAPVISVGSNQIFLFRLVILACIPLIFIGLIRVPRELTRSREFKRFALSIAIFVVIGLLSLFWSRDVNGGVFEIATVAMAMVLMIVLYVLIRRTGVSGLYIAWILSGMAAFSVAVWELSTGNHLESSWTMSAPDYAKEGKAVSFFGNPNDFAGYLIMLYAVLLSATSHAKQKALRLGAAAFLILTVGMTVVTTSRSGLLGLIAVTIVWYTALSGQRGVFKIALACVILVPVLEFFISGSNFVAQYLPRFTTIGSELYGLGSAGIRLNLMLNSFYALFSTAGIGIGAGGFEEWILSGSAPYPTGVIVNAHNLWLEIASQYGLIVVMAILWWLGSSFRLGVKAAASPRSQARQLGSLLSCLCIGYFLVGFGSSSMLTASSNALYLATIGVVSCLIAADQNNRNRTRDAS